MKYLLDTNSLSKDVLNRVMGRTDICVIRDVVDEDVFYKEEETKFFDYGIKILELDKIHYEKLIELMSEFGDEFSLIRLFTNKGKADVLILAYVLAEKEMRHTLFTEEFTIITKDKPLITVAEKYGIPCADTI